MKNTLLSLLTTVAFVAPTFASASAESDQLTASTPETHSASIIIETTEDVFTFGAPVERLRYNPETQTFVGSPLKFKIGEWDLTIKSDPLGIYTSKGSGFGDTHSIRLPQPCTVTQFYAKLFEAMSFVVSKQESAPLSLKLNPCDLFKLRQITMKVFSPNPNAWKFETPDQLKLRSREIVSDLLKRYHLPTLTDEIRNIMSGFATNHETLPLMASKTYDRNISSPQCAEEIKSAFLQISEILAYGAYYCRAHDLPLPEFFKNFSPDVAAIATMLFELDDKVGEYQTIKILGSDHEVTGLPMLSPQQIDFVTRWVNCVLSPSVIKVTTLSADGRDGLPLLPEILTRPENLWDEYARHVFGKTESVIFARKPASVTPSS